MEKLILVAAAVVAGIVGLVFLSFLLSWPVMWLWNNALVGAITGINQVSWLQAWGISTLSGLLFKTSVSNK
jgi:multidrug efflux pump subunit AcrB